VTSRNVVTALSGCTQVLKLHAVSGLRAGGAVHVESSASNHTPEWENFAIP
jgi:hypothetical protein